MLTLDTTTLFYWNLSDNLKKHKFKSSVVSQWAQSIPNDTKPANRAFSIGKQSIQSVVPSLTKQSTVTVICLGCNKDLWSHRSKYKSYGALRV